MHQKNLPPLVPSSPTVLPNGAASLVQVSAPSQRGLASATVLLDLPAGATAVPLHLSAGGFVFYL